MFFEISSNTAPVLKCEKKFQKNVDFVVFFRETLKNHQFIS